MDEWINIANANVIMESGSITEPHPMCPEEKAQCHWFFESGLHLLLVLFKSVADISWMTVFRYLPSCIFVFTVLSVYLLGKRHGFGWEAALWTCLIITTVGILGPAFLVGVSVGLPFIALSLYLAYNFRTLWSYVVVFLLMTFLLALHPPTAVGLGILLLPYIVLSLKGNFRHAAGLSLSGGLPLIPALVVLDRDVIVHYLKQIYSSHPLDENHVYPELIPEFGYIPVACCLLGLVILVRKGGKEAWGLVAGFVLLLLMLVIKSQFDYGMGILYLRGLMYTMLVMAIIGGCGLAALKGFRLPAFLTGRIKPAFLARNAGNVLCLAVIAATFTLAIPDRQDEDFYHKIDDDDYQAFVWVEKNLGKQFAKAIVDPSQAVAFIAITGKEVYSKIGVTNDAHARKAHRFLSSGCTDTEFLKKNGISIVYTWRKCENPDLTERWEDVYVLE
ncbi:MAG: hypothetical protein R6U37_03110 [Dehalococcoidia bacterium]